MHLEADWVDPGQMTINSPSCCRQRSKAWGHVEVQMYRGLSLEWEVDRKSCLSGVGIDFMVKCTWQVISISYTK